MQGGGLVQAAGVLAERGAADASLWLGNRRTWWLRPFKASGEGTNVLSRRAGCGDRSDTWLVSAGW